LKKWENKDKELKEIKMTTEAYRADMEKGKTVV